MGKDKLQDAAIGDHVQQKKLYGTAHEFLDSISLNVDTSEAIYKCRQCMVFPTTNVDDEYVVLVLEIVNEDLRKFYEGNFMVQHWSKKVKLYQHVHKCSPHKFFLN